MDFIKDCLGQLRLFVRLITAIVKKQEEQDGRIYRLEESNRLLKADNRILSEELRKQAMALADVLERS